MRAKMDPDHFSGFHDHLSGSLVRYRENTGIVCITLLLGIFLEPIGNLLRDETRFPVFSAFWVPEDQFPTLYVPFCQIEDLADPEIAPGHQFHNQPAPGFHGPAPAQ